MEKIKFISIFSTRQENTKKIKTSNIYGCVKVYLRIIDAKVESLN
ncbi:hypothetical protein ACSXB8_12480 [Clostridium perfringens]|uniref:Uncharacterized protein n=1 Tax=Clostridium perfringens (strain SM101 / Type A) TaxID=289380 RepID=Q0SVR6_CLOPS|nr:hypothetical protein [Clostridium perfringens]ABG85732.1 hypothetical protein CPR_0455 [Clostridium perfringens SM101]MDU1474941.1 hypothetical protein [Clostridium perfringens]MDU2827011.1 hypothetical protein [Clostridium perfringens]SQB58290.1 Uncharacterised protein [Clostridium perfringens]